MAGSGTTISSVLAGEQAQAAGTAEDTLEGAASGESPAFGGVAVSSDYFYWAAGDPASAEAGAPVDAGGSGGEGGDLQAGGGAALVAGDALVYDGVRIAIGDWGDPDWTGTPWLIDKLPWIEGDFSDVVIGLPDFDGDGFGDVVSGDYGYYAVGGDYSYDGDWGYSDGSGDFDGDGFEGAYDGEYYYGGYTITSAGDINGDGFEDFVVGGYGYSYVQYGGDYSYAGDGDYAYAGDGDYSSAGDGPVGVEVERGVIVFSPDWDWSNLENLNIQVSGNAVLSWTSGNEFVISAAGDSQVFIGTGDNDVVLNSLSSGNIRLTTAGIIGELNTVIAY